MNTEQLQNDKLIIMDWINQLEDYSILEKVKSIMRYSDACLLSNNQKKP